LIIMRILFRIKELGLALVFGKPRIGRILEKLISA